MEQKQLSSAIEQICEEKGISKEVVLETIEMALASAYKKEATENSIHNFSHVIFERDTQIYTSVEKKRLEDNPLEKYFTHVL